MPYVTRLNHSLIKQRAKDQLEILKAENAKKIKKKLKDLKLKVSEIKQGKDQLEILKAENAKKIKKLKDLKLKVSEINVDPFIKNTIKNYNKNKPKQKKMSDLFEFPKINYVYNNINILIK